MLSAQRRLDRRGLLAGFAAAGALEGGADLGDGQPGRLVRGRGPRRQFQGVGGVQVLERLQRCGE
jgi:hypothetical protein